MLQYLSPFAHRIACLDPVDSVGTVTKAPTVTESAHGDREEDGT
jgi:hypothetical protein